MLKDKGNFVSKDMKKDIVIIYISEEKNEVFIYNRMGFAALYPSYDDEYAEKDCQNQGKKKKKAWRYLLSHGETPHYHRRVTVSLLSSRRDQVGPVHY
jgi:hypothetical protein